MKICVTSFEVRISNWFNALEQLDSSAKLANKKAFLGYQRENLSKDSYFLEIDSIYSQQEFLSMIL